MSISHSQNPMLSPCTGVCTLDIEGYCAGCHRTGEEIARWMSMSDVERERLMNLVLPQRAYNGLGQ